MAKRKRLTPPTAQDVAAEDVAPQDLQAAPETKSALSGPILDAPIGMAPGGVSPGRRAPIADLAGAASANAALQQVAAEIQTAKSEGRLITKIPLAQIAVHHLIRDRVVVDNEEMRALKASLQARGQQHPIEVQELRPNEYGLISGFRRLQALRELEDEGGVGHVLALIRQPGDAGDAYIAMVEENEIRVGLSYFERANIVARAVEVGVFDTEKAALNRLFAAASRSKRSKIKSFLPIIDALGSVLIFPHQLGERLGLALSQRLGGDAGFGAQLKETLRKASPETAVEESEIIIQALEHKPPKRAEPPAPAPAEPGISLKRGTGGLILSGQGVTPAFEQALSAFLKRWHETR